MVGNQSVVKNPLLLLAPFSFALLLVLSLVAKLDGVRLPAQLEWSEAHWKVVAGSEPLQPGDLILRIEGRPVEFVTLLGDPVQLHSAAELQRWLSAKAVLYARLKRGHVRLEVTRQGTEIPLEVAPRRDTFLSWGREVWIELVPACVFLWAGWTTLARAPRRPESFWFCLMCLLTSLCYLASTPFRNGAFVEPTLTRLVLALNLIAFLYGPAVLLHVTLWVPERSLGKAGLALLYGLVTLVLLCGSLPMQVALVGGLYAAVLLAVVWATWRYRSSVHRQQMKWIWFGYVLGLTPGLVFNGLPLLLGRQRLFEDAFVGFFLICIPWFYSLAIQRYRLFDIETLAEGSLVYLFTLALICLLEMSLLAGLGSSLALPAGTLLLMAILASAYGAVHTRVARVMERPDPAVVERFQTQASGRGSEQVLQCLYESLQEWPAPLSLEWCSPRPGVGCHLRLEDPVCLEFCLEAPRGLVLGPLPQGLHYNRRVLLVLERLARQAALLYQNARMFEQEAERRERALAEREGLLNDLHDGVGASLASIRMVSGQPEVSALAGDALFELQHFLYDGLDYTLEARAWVAELRAYGNRVHPDFSLSARLEDEQINRSLGLRVFRSFREKLQQGRELVCLRAELSLAQGQVRLVLGTATDDPVSSELFGPV